MSFLDIGRRPVETVAVATDYFERTQILHSAGEVQLSAELERHLERAGGLTFRPLKYSTTVRNYTIENVVLDADTLLLVKDGVTIAETSYFVPGHKSHEPSVDDNGLIRLPPDEDIVFGYNNAHSGYQHWVTQCVPAVDWSLRQRRTRPVRLLMPALQPWQEDFLRILGHDAVPRLLPEAGRQYLLPRVEYSQFLNGSTSFRVCLSTRETAQRILRALPTAPTDHKTIYVPCANPYYGTLANAAEVEALVRHAGVYVVDQDNLDTATRINLFRHADLVMGPHGQGLTDILFCRPGTVLWEWTPPHLQNTSINRLAQAAGAYYRGELFESTRNLQRPDEWYVDFARIAHGLSELARRFPARAVAPATDATAARPVPSVVPPAGKPIDELMLAFENLGANCEFGLVQRHAGVEPLGLLRFAGMMVSGEARIGRLVDALERRFEGLGAPGTISVYLTGEGGEYMARESVYNLQYHTGVFAEGTTAEKVALREPKRLNFLRRKFEADLAAGEKIWVWQSMDTHQIDQVLPLLHALRAAGPNRLLWVVECDADHKPGTAERLDRDFFKGYVDHFNSLSLELCAASWIDACQSAYDLCFATEPAPTHPAADIAPAHPVAGIAPADRVANEVPAHSVSDRAPPARPPPAIDCLARNQPTPPASASPVFARRAWGFGGIMSTVLRHLRGQRT